MSDDFLTPEEFESKVFLRDIGFSGQQTSFFPQDRVSLRPHDNAQCSGDWEEN